jgi:beta-glucosidase
MGRMGSDMAAPFRGRWLASIAALSGLLLGVVALQGHGGGATGSAASATPTAAVVTHAAQEDADRSSDCPWLNDSLSVDARIGQLIDAMSPLQEATLLHLISDNASDPYEGHSPAIPALCIPSITEQDGSAGVANGWTHSFGGTTQLPAPIADAAAFDPTLARSYGSVIGTEDAAKGVDMALAPTLNIDRSPLWGRSYESLGEDPFLTASLGVQLVEGIQEHRVVSVTKHFAVYNQETKRATSSDDAIVSARAMHEIYLPAFSAVVQQAHPGGIMCSYNLINGTPACQDLSLLSQTLRGEWGFAGFVRSDCGSVYSQAPAIAAGVSQVKCSPLYNPKQLAAAVSSGTLSRASLNSLAEPLLRVLFTYNLIARPHPATPHAPVAVTADEHVALQTANEGAVLLKNTADLLPLQIGRLSSLALIGADSATPMPAGFGAIYVRPVLRSTILAAFKTVLGRRLHYADGSDVAAAVAIARGASAAIIVAHDVEIERHDRVTLRLPGNQDALITAVERVNHHTIVVLETGAPVLTPWLPTTPALIETWYPGEAAGTSLLQLVSGQVDPSGKLPVTFPVSQTAMPDDSATTFGGVGGRTLYSDGIDVGYRWYEAHHVTPAFSFGYGLSYTRFGFSGLRVDTGGPGRLTVSARITNLGSRIGSDVAQCYVGDPASAGEPARQLRGFQRVSLTPGAATTVTMAIAPGDLAVWDTPANRWKIPAGAYQVWVGDGSDSANLPLHQTVLETGQDLGPNSGPSPQRNGVAPRQPSPPGSVAAPAHTL